MILLEGTGSVSPRETYSPIGGAVHSYCYYSDGGSKTAFPAALTLGNTKPGCPGTGPCGLIDNYNVYAKPSDTVGSSMTDRLASHGSLVILPWSFNGVWMDGTDTHPLVHVDGSTGSDADNTPVATDAFRLHAEIASVHALWPDTRIVVLAHSLGGLVAEQYWEYYWRTIPDHEGVTRVVSLDGPINGVADARLFCTVVFTSSTCPGAPVAGPAVVNLLDALWGSIDWHDRAISANDGDGAFLPIGTEADSYYARVDPGIDPFLTQLLFNCNGFITETCTPLPPAFVSCPSSDHQRVKACPAVIDYLEHAVFAGAAAAKTAATAAVRPSEGLGNLALHVRVPQQRLIAGSPWARSRSPAGAPGAALRLTGAGLGTVPGAVRFARRGGGTIPAQIRSWTPGSVTVRVPAGSVSGPLTLTTASERPVPVPGVAILTRANRVDRLVVARRVTAPIGTQIALSVQALHAAHPVPDEVVSLFDGVRQISSMTNRLGLATFTVNPVMSGSLVVLSGRTWRNVTVGWTAPPVTSIRLTITPAHPRRGRRITVVAVLRGDRGPAGSAPMTLVLATRRASYTRHLTSNPRGRASTSFTAPVGPASLIATSYGTTAVRQL